MAFLRSTLSTLLATALTLAAVTLPAQAQIQVPAAPLVKVETSLGEFTLELDGLRAPISTANFLKYVEDGYYEGTIFHRVIAGFMAQGGGFTADMQQKDTRDPIPNESGNGLSNGRGTIAMARTADPHSGTAQFFINLVDNRNLDPSPQRWGYAVFGRVIEGMGVVDEMAAIPTGARRPLRSDVPKKDIVIQKMTVVEPQQ